jgi:hypothetical protein
MDILTRVARISKIPLVVFLITTVTCGTFLHFTGDPPGPGQYLVAALWAAPFAVLALIFQKLK